MGRPLPLSTMWHSGGRGAPHSGPPPVATHSSPTRSHAPAAVAFSQVGAVSIRCPEPDSNRHGRAASEV